MMFFFSGYLNYLGYQQGHSPGVQKNIKGPKSVPLVFSLNSKTHLGRKTPPRERIKGKGKETHS